MKPSRQGHHVKGARRRREPLIWGSREGSLPTGRRGAACPAWGQPRLLKELEGWLYIQLQRGRLRGTLGVSVRAPPGDAEGGP